MKAGICSTDKVVTLVSGGAEIPARVWVGVSANGVSFLAFITRIAVMAGEDAAEFDRELKEQPPPAPEVEGIPLRMIL